MSLDTRFYVHTGRNGRLEQDTPPAALDAMFENDIADANQLVLHFHGGLVSQAGGMRTAGRLVPEYQEFAHPVFFVWEAGAIEAPMNNWDELAAGLLKIADESVFRKIHSVVTKWTVGKLQTDEGTKAPGDPVDLPNPIDHAVEMQKTSTNEEPYEEVRESEGELAPVTPEQEAALIAELARDAQFVAGVEAVLRYHGEVKDDDGLKAALPNVAPEPTLMEDAVLDELAGEVEPGTRGLISATLLAKRAAKVFARVIKRFIAHRDHGVYTTVVEELLRELYLANVGGVVWKIMKDETADTFKTVAGENRGGDYFLRKLIELDNRRPEKIVLVGHSTGAVFINEMLKATRAARVRGDLPADFAYSGVVFLAPACSFAHLAQVLPADAGGPADGGPPLFEEFRLFAMDDEHESSNKLASYAYPRSLLYFVSGVVEREDDDSSAFDLPLVGMDRFYWRARQGKDAHADLGDHIAAVRRFVLQANRAVWSVTADDALPGHRSDSISHGGFDDTGIDSKGKPIPRATIDSVRHILQIGWG